MRAVRRGDTLTINGEMFWVDRVSPDDGEAVISGSTVGNHPLLTGDDKRRGEIMAIKGLDQAIDNLSRVRKTPFRRLQQWPLTAWPQRRLISLHHRLPGRQRYAGNW